MDETSARSSLDDLRALVSRVVHDNWPGTSSDVRLRLLPRSLPADLPVDLPLLPDARLVGSMAHGSQSVAIVDVEGQPEEAFRRYGDLLQQEGWQRRQDFGPRGFLPAEQSLPLHALFCSSPQGPALWVWASARDSGTSQLQLRLDTDTANSICSRPPGPPGPRGRRGTLPDIPALVAPPGAAHRGQMMGSDPGGDMAEVDLQTELDADALERHYRPQLVAAGWRPIDAGGTGPVNVEHLALAQPPGGGATCLLPGLGSAWCRWRCPPRAERETDSSGPGGPRAAPA